MKRKVDRQNQERNFGLKSGDSGIPIQKENKAPLGPRGEKEGSSIRLSSD